MISGVGHATILWLYGTLTHCVLAVGIVLYLTILALCARVRRPSNMLARFRRALSVFAGRRGALAARARSPDRVSADPWRVRLSGLQGPPRNLLSRDRGGWVLPPRDLWCRGMVVEAALLSLSSVAADDGDTERNTSLGPRAAITIVVDMAGADVVTAPLPFHRLLRWQRSRFCGPSRTSRGHGCRSRTGGHS